MTIEASPRTVSLRPLADDDRDRLRHWRNDPEVARYMYSDHEIGAAEHARWFDAARCDAGRRYWLIEHGGQPVGLANLYDIDARNRRCGWAYYLASPSVRGKGVGSYVEYFVLRHVFEDMGLNKLWCEVLASNEAVWRLHESFGFRREALHRDHVFKAGAFHDVIGLAMLAAEWQGLRAGLRARVSAKGFALD